ncbi:MAG: hypothetical protein HOV79_10330 [Hamadaea sp.]|nr:hypothetical protein [Hamadaea sp.]
MITMAGAAGLAFCAGAGQNPGMPTESDAQAAQRRGLLAPVARLCFEAGVPVRMGRLDGPHNPSVVALVCGPADGSWDASVTVVRAHSVPAAHQDWNGRWGRDPRDGYDLGSDGTLVYEVQVHEDDDGGTGHGRRPIVVFELHETERAVADAMILWWRRPWLFHTPPPIPGPGQERRRERVAEHRRLAAAYPQVRMSALPPPARELAAQLDPASVARNFPRGVSGRFQRSAVVALTALDDTPLHLRGAWLAARCLGDGLTVTVEELIGGNQEHRWDRTPWLWDRRRADAGPRERWQADEPGQVSDILAALRCGAVAEALALAGVDVDDQLGRLLAGRPNRLFRAGLTQKWVTNLHLGLAEAAPWRFGDAHRAWRAERGHRARRPAPLFGLKGLNQARKPKVALDVEDGRPILRLVFTASNLQMPRSLWTVPTDFPA